MNSGDLYLDTYVTNVSLPYFIYALIFNRAGQALRVVSAGVYRLSSGDVPFVNANQASCAIQLHSDRLDHYSIDLPASGLTLPANDYTDCYTAEYWQTSGTFISGTPIPNRYTDIFLDRERFYWDGIYRAEQRIASSQFASEYTCQLSAAYDSVAQVVTLKAWLELGGELITNPQSCLVTWKDNNNALIFSGSSTTPDSNGAFSFTQLNANLTPDSTTTVLVTIVDGNSLSHSTLCSIVAWD